MKIKSLIAVFDKALFYKRFDAEVNKSHIKYDWDGGHCYSYISHPLVENNFDDDAEQYANDWLYENDECPPCAIHLYKDGTVGSGCGCHDNLTDPEVIDSIVKELEAIPKRSKYLVTREE
jgi:hypothetical protein